MREQLVAEMNRVFGDDRRRIDHAMKVLENAETILATEPEADTLTVQAAAILHDIGIHEAERKHGSCTGRLQELEGPPIARAILERLGLDEKTTRRALAKMLHGGVDTFFESGLAADEVLDLIPVKPLESMEKDLREAYRARLRALHDKLTKLPAPAGRS